MTEKCKCGAHEYEGFYYFCSHCGRENIDDYAINQIMPEDFKEIYGIWEELDASQKAEVKGFMQSFVKTTKH